MMKAGEDENQLRLLYSPATRTGSETAEYPSARRFIVIFYSYKQVWGAREWTQ